MHADTTDQSSPGEFPPRSAWLRFFDTFLQEKNIKWMLGLGGLILFASSLMLVTSHWQDYTPLWKSLVVVGYTAVLFILGEIAYETLTLRRTGISLMAMTVMLIPVSLLAVRIMHADIGSGQLAGIIGLLTANIAFAGFAGRRILKRFLREDQPTFLASYLLLSLAGAIVPGLAAQWAMPAALLLWVVFFAGTIKVNRHVFWLGEEHRLPRIFGFFPILLLGTQFFILFAFLAPQIELSWMGLGLVLTSLPVLMTADSLAKVFEERTGNLVRPLPWSLVLPLLAGLGLCIAGVGLSWTGFPSTSAAVPTAYLAAAIFVQVARRTQHAGFIWAMWGSILLGYQASPVFFRELAKSIVQQGASAVSEARLPLAFYGLTYLPLLVVAVLTAIICQRKGYNFIAKPTRSFAVGLTSVLWAASLMHPKAIFPVGLSTLLMFGWQMFAFRMPRLRFALVGVWITTSLGVCPFLAEVLHWNLVPEANLWVMCLSATLLLLPDRFLPRVRNSDTQPATQRHPLAVGDVSSLVLTLGLGAAWVAFSSLSKGSLPWLSATMIVVLFLGHALRWCERGLSLLALIYAGLSGAILAHLAGATSVEIASVAIIIAGGLWILGIVLNRTPERRISRAFAKASEQVSGATLALGLVGFSLPRFLEVLAGFPRDFWWISTIVPLAWVFDAARRWRSEAWTIFGGLGVLGLVGAASVTMLGRELAWSWLPVIWSLAGIIVVPITPRPFRWSVEPSEVDTPKLPSHVEYIIAPLGRLVTVLFVVLAVGTLPFFSLAARLASGTSLLGLFCLAGDWRNAWLRQLALILVNWHLLSGVIQIVLPDANHLLDLERQGFLLASLPLALTAALTRLLWNLSNRQAGTPLGEWVSFHRLLLLGFTVLGLFTSLNFLPTGLSPVSLAMAIGVFLVLIADQIWQAVRQQEEAHVWVAEGIILAAIGYLLWFEVIQLGSGLSMFAVLIAGWVAWTIGTLAAKSARWQVLTQPLVSTGLILPAVTVGLGIVRHVFVPQSLWLGMNSLALLFAGAFYFWRGIEEKQSHWLLAAAAILNVALALLWRELHWNDPQLFAIPLGISILAIVQWLKDEIPAKAHDPLRYLGALVILVSPVFHIVGGSWLHLLTLMIASVLVTLAAMGLRIRALMYTGTGFLIGDLIAMVVRGSIDNPTLLWIAGILIGLAVISLAAYCEKHREQVLQRLRMMAARLETWD